MLTLEERVSRIEQFLNLPDISAIKAENERLEQQTKIELEERQKQLAEIYELFGYPSFSANSLTKRDARKGVTALELSERLCDNYGGTPI